MYMVKKTNKGQFKEFDFGVYNKHSYLLYSKNELNHILENESIYYQFQPIVDAASGEIVAYEALMRPRGETIQNPAALISLAKAHYKLEKIETMTFFKALKAFSELTAACSSDCKLFINSVANQCLSDDDEDRLALRFAEYMPRIVREISAEEEPDEKSMTRKLDFMRRYGQALALDDFGTGSGGDAIIQKYSPLYIKIDISIIKNIHEDENHQALTRRMIEYGEENGVMILAEGVELKEEMEFLVNAGIHLMQGYYLCQPMATPPLELPEIKSEIAVMRGETA
jgi:EAL domain-containing protein (putative c-di-GMP-specific phosphodiesterase class I)